RGGTWETRGSWWPRKPPWLGLAAARYGAALSRAPVYGFVPRRVRGPWPRHVLRGWSRLQAGKRPAQGGTGPSMQTEHAGLNYLKTIRFPDGPRIAPCSSQPRGIP